MKIEIHLYSQSVPCVIEHARNAYTKDGLYCVMAQDGPVYKWPLQHIFRIKEMGGPSFTPARAEDD